MLPCSTIFEGFARLVRDIAREQRKEVSLVIKGGETQLDKKVLDKIKGPLIHLLRNAVDHGIDGVQERREAGKPEQGTITLSSSQEGGKVVVTVSDDGRGIDGEAVRRVALAKGLVTEEELARMTDQAVSNLIFMPGFSTAMTVTDVSGRGVGLDVVRSEVEQLKGSVEVVTQKGRGTTVRIALPLTIAILQVLQVEDDGLVWAIPMSNLDATVKVSREAVATLSNRMVVQVRGQSVPIAPLRDVLGMSRKPAPSATSHDTDDYRVVIVNVMNKRVGLIVDRILGEDEIFIKNLGPHLGKIKGVGGAAILPTGLVIAVLDLRDLVAQAQAAPISIQPREPATERTQKRLLVVEDSLTTRELERMVLEGYGYAVETAVDGLDAMDKLSRGRFDAIIADILMPRMNGFELCKSVKANERLKQIPVIFVTSMEKEEDRRKGLEMGAQAYIVKSEFDQSALRDALERLI